MESVSPEHSRRNEVSKFDLYQHEAVPNCILVYPDGAKVDGFVDGSYRKVGDFPDEFHAFEVGEALLKMDFGRLWTRKRGDACREGARNF